MWNPPGSPCEEPLNVLQSAVEESLGAVPQRLLLECPSWGNPYPPQTPQLVEAVPVSEARCWAVARVGESRASSRSFFTFTKTVGYIVDRSNFIEIVDEVILVYNSDK